ncbi:hypothetical protein [Streptomyces sp. NPDC050848]|uniref:hypothetical protein n=1 Tax=Streptomyces sp. NPDC050848 TaxID=3155791 RepID=UPI0033F32BD1
MRTRIARGLAGTALVVALATSAACGGGGGGPVGGDTTPTETTGPPASESESGGTLGTVFPGKDGGGGGGGEAAPVRVPTAKVHKPTGGKVKVRNTTSRPMRFLNPTAAPDDPDSGSASAGIGTCAATLAPEGECEMVLEYTPYDPGPYSGVLTVETEEGEALAVPFSGEAVEDEPTATDSSLPTPTDTETVDPTPTDTETVDPTPTETDPVEPQGEFT